MTKEGADGAHTPPIKVKGAVIRAHWQCLNGECGHTTVWASSGPRSKAPGEPKHRGNRESAVNFAAVVSSTIAGMVPGQQKDFFDSLGVPSVHDDKTYSTTQQKVCLRSIVAHSSNSS